MACNASDALAGFLGEHRTVTVVSGAGVSTASGIPDYRDRNGSWKQAPPMLFQEFIGSDAAQRRYWARSFVGWRRFSGARPNAAHAALAAMEADGRIDTVVTQNVDRLHTSAGSDRVIDLHGRLDKVRCLDCRGTESRAGYQRRLEQSNAAWHAKVFRYRPDGDAELAANSHERFEVAGCTHCGGTVKPDVVMFGESVPRGRVDAAMRAVGRACALLVVGSSLMVFSGFRFVREAAALGKPIAIVNRGRTRADDLAALKVERNCVDALPAALARLH